MILGLYVLPIADKWDLETSDVIKGVVHYVPEEEKYVCVDDGEDEEGHDVLRGEDDEGEAVLVQLRGERLGADLRQDQLGAARPRVHHPVHSLVEQQRRCHCN